MSAAAPLLRLLEIEGKGRSLVASQPLKAGQVVLRDSPILLYSALPLTKQQPSNAYSYCDTCFRALPSSQSSSSSSTSVVCCPSCSYHLFCNPDCLRVALASSHSPWVCQGLSRLRDSPPLLLQPLERQVQARFLIAGYNLAAFSPSDFSILLSLQGRGSPADDIASAAHFLHSLISSLCPPPPIPQGFSVELTAALLVKDKLNAFGLMEPFSQDRERSVRAYGIYPKASFFNHDCLPNACRFDYVDAAPDHNTDIVVRLIHDVPEGREICLSYFPVNENFSSRQKRLKEDYGFTCDCDRCKVEANWSDQEDEEEVMDEDEEEEMAGSDTGENNGQDFPHAYFFLRYMCSRHNCGGTLAPLAPSDGTCNVMECNVCGKLKNVDEDEDDDDDDGGEDGLPMDE